MKNQQLTSSTFILENDTEPPTTAPLSAAYPKEDVLGGVEACGIDPCRVRWGSLADDAAGEAGDGALDRLGVCVALAACHRVRHDKVYRTLRRSTDLVRRQDIKMN